MKIVGAGLAGLLAAHAWPGAALFEAAPAPHASHRALLRFRSEAVSQLTGITFRPVTVRKGIWYGGRFVEPTIQLANFYAQKVTGSLSGDRSLWSLAPAERFIAPESFYDQLIETVGARVAWNSTFDFSRSTSPIINTSPLPAVLKAFKLTPDGVEFRRAAIRVERYRVTGADVFQTIYFPDPAHSLYRASITGSLLICESVISAEYREVLDIEPFEAFGLKGSVTPIDIIEQHYGKIVPLPDAIRKPLLYRLTTEHGIFSLGRFATFRNILLDDVVGDIAVIRKLIKASGYERAIFSAT